MANLYINRKIPSTQIIHCSKCAEVISLKEGYVATSWRTQKNLVEKIRRQKQLHTFCKDCWDGIISREELSFNSHNKIQVLNIIKPIAQ
jgi:hypothetical protein